MKEINIFNNEKKILLDAAVTTGLPILITGELGAGKTTIAKYLSSTFDKTVHDDNGDTSYEDEDVYVTTDRFINRYRKKVKEYIEIRCHYVPEQKARYIQISLHKKDIKYTTDKLIPTLPFVIIKGQNAKAFADRFEDIETININDKSKINRIIEAIEIRRSYTRLNDNENYTKTDLQLLHFTCDLEELYGYLMGKGFISILSNLEKVGVMITAYTEEVELVCPLYVIADSVVDI